MSEHYFMRTRKIENGNLVSKEDGSYELLYPDARIPEYSTKTASGADIFAAEEIVIEPHSLGMVHTGISVWFPDNEAFIVLSRSSMPKMGLILANGVGLFENDYFHNPSNDGEILFCFYNYTDKPVRVEKGLRIGQGVFILIERAEGAVYRDNVRQGGFGSTGK